ncbi:MAG: hypothetical protein ACRDT6_01515 [Micromonosporaceae bacterium]
MGETEPESVKEAVGVTPRADHDDQDAVPCPDPSSAHESQPSEDTSTSDDGWVPV